MVNINNNRSFFKSLVFGDIHKNNQYYKFNSACKSLPKATCLVLNSPLNSFDGAIGQSLSASGSLSPSSFILRFSTMNKAPNEFNTFYKFANL